MLCLFLYELTETFFVDLISSKQYYYRTKILRNVLKAEHRETVMHVSKLQNPFDILRLHFQFFPNVFKWFCWVVKSLSFWKSYWKQPILFIIHWLLMTFRNGYSIRRVSLYPAFKVLLAFPEKKWSFFFILNFEQ